MPHSVAAPLSERLCYPKAFRQSLVPKRHTSAHGFTDYAPKKTAHTAHPSPLSGVAGPGPWLEPVRRAPLGDASARHFRGMLASAMNHGGNVSPSSVVSRGASRRAAHASDGPRTAVRVERPVAGRQSRPPGTARRELPFEYPLTACAASRPRPRTVPPRQRHPGRRRQPARSQTHF